MSGVQPRGELRSGSFRDLRDIESVDSDGERFGAEARAVAGGAERALFCARRFGGPRAATERASPIRRIESKEIRFGGEKLARAAATSPIVGEGDERPVRAVDVQRVVGPNKRGDEDRTAAFPFAERGFQCFGEAGFVAGSGGEAIRDSPNGGREVFRIGSIAAADDVVADEKAREAPGEGSLLELGECRVRWDLDREQDLEAGFGSEGAAEFDDVWDGVGKHQVVALVANYAALLRKESGEEVLQVGDGGYGGAAAAGESVLVHGEWEREASDFVDVRAFDLIQLLADGGGAAVEIAALAFGEEGVAGETGFSGATDADDGDPTVEGEIEGDVLEVVGAGSLNVNLV